MVWYKIEVKPPIATETGDWDGKKSDKILVATRNKKMHIAEMYEGTMDGSHFRNFYDDRDFEIENVILWAELDVPF